ncbi:MAG: flagellar FliJ family protein [Acidobacteria bacterium]|nr:flagellar FliJ family protein [Acidobacteriota bacterium]
MSGFRFRAQAALDVRRRQLVTAQRDLARAEHVRDAARQGVVDADAAVARARRAASEQLGAPRSSTALEWYRFWILRLDHERAAAAALLSARDRDVTAAAAACLRAKQRCESLERLREKARRAHARAEADVERKTIDELAARRFSAWRAEEGRVRW